MEVSPCIAFFFLFFGMVAFNDLMVGSPWTGALRVVADAAGLSGAI
ncbi:hypothetical protein OHB41_47015 [Streptomyces sp. NBC_01571]|nr:hypothetical protein [Streptomyces sp. NBC_01571]MCX4580569.1 hypothetical protein [Streptomyces sp. NBC_01571]